MEFLWFYLKFNTKINITVGPKTVKFLYLRNVLNWYFYERINFV